MPVPIDGDTPFDRQAEHEQCQQHWPDTPRWLLVSGTFTRLLYWQPGKLHCYGGGLFPLGDPASLARLGLWGVQAMLQAAEGITPLTPLASQLFTRFSGHIEQVVDWSKRAQAADYAALTADMLAHPDDPLAQPLLSRAAQELWALLHVARAQQAEQVWLSGPLCTACLAVLGDESHREAC
ncbi:Glucosamine kinase GpsK [Dickeya aquatica]|uniref:Glucosamine kinase GpsK n=2 Tax=Pectobacteriaceae TaxID=1903410 RepID=A0A375AEN8_9GAMM|nr:Glucosamine kinase GpsK [Dickeya aquatica]